MNRILAACLWLMMLVTFSLPGREGALSLGAIDPIAALKVGTRAVALLSLGLLIWWHWDQPARPRIARWLSPFGLFVLWAIASTAWSPLKVFSLGQAASLAALYGLACAVALTWSEPLDTRRVLRHLVLGLLLVSLTLFAVDLYSHDLSGLNREWTTGGAPGLLHPTTAAATASLGLVLLVVMPLIWKDAVALKLIVPGVLIHAAVLGMAVSRMALAMSALVVGTMLLKAATRLTLATVAIGICLAGILYPIFDPGFDKAAAAAGAVTGYLTRGESTEQLMSLTGRTDLWSAVWDAVPDSPIRGFGYQVASPDGEVDVFAGPAYRTAHNVLLQVLVSTGLVGTALFIVGLVVPLRRARSYLRRDEEGRRLWRLVLVLGAWYAGWGLLSESFMGPLAPESVVFFSVLGLAAGHAGARAGTDGQTSGNTERARGAP